MMSLPMILLISGFLISAVFTANIGINHGTYTQTGPYGPSLDLLRSENVFIIKAFDIVPEVLDAMEITYAKVNFGFFETLTEKSMGPGFEKFSDGEIRTLDLPIQFKNSKNSTN